MITISALIFSAYTIFLSSCVQTNNASFQNTIVSSDSTKITVGNSPGSVEAADFNNDNFADLVITSETDSSVTVLLGDGKGKFKEVQDHLFLPARSLTTFPLTILIKMVILICICQSRKKISNCLIGKWKRIFY